MVVLLTEQSALSVPFANEDEEEGKTTPTDLSDIKTGTQPKETSP
jgi:hypothetical protein